MKEKNKRKKESPWKRKNPILTLQKQSSGIKAVGKTVDGLVLLFLLISPHYTLSSFFFFICHK